MELTVVPAAETIMAASEDLDNIKKNMEDVETLDMIDMGIIEGEIVMDLMEEIEKDIMTMTTENMIVDEELKEEMEEKDGENTIRRIY